MAELYYIRTQGYSGNSFIWWGKNGAGYTPDLNHAGRYTKEEAEAICKRRPEQDIAYKCEEIEASKGIQKHFDSQFSASVQPAISFI